MRVRPRRYAAIDTPELQERRLAAALGGRRQPGSGSSAYAKGDVVAPRGRGGHVGLVVEAKQTVHASLSVQWAWLVKITGEALAQGKVPALAFTIQGGVAAPGVERDWIAVPASAFTALTRAAGGEGDE